MSNTINLTTNLKTYDLVFTDRNNETTQITFNPYDLDLITRINSAEANIRSAMEELGKTNDDKTTEAEIVEQTRQIVMDEVDKIFASPISKEVFKYCHPLTTDASGKSYIERFLDAMIPVMKKDIEESNKASQKRIESHTGKYAKISNPSVKKKAE